MSEQERTLREQLERDWFNVTLAISHYVESCKAIDKYREEQAGRLAAERTEAGIPIF